MTSNVESDSTPFSCFLFNGPVSNPKMLAHAGYSGSQNDIWIQFSMDWSNIGNQTQNWVGLYVFFLEAGTDPAAAGVEISDVQNSACILAGGVVSVLSLTKIIQTTIDPTPTTTINYVSVVNTAPWGPGTFSETGFDSASYYAVSVSYADLAVQTLTQRHAYTIINVLGDFCGTIGALIGIDVLKVFLLISLLPKFVMAVYRKVTGQGSPELP